MVQELIDQLKFSYMEEDRYVHEDEIDTLSLSDLLIYDNNGDDPQDFYRLDHNQNPINVDVEDHFEFSIASHELLKTSVINNGVVFGGKIIPYNEPSTSQNPRTLERKKLTKSYKQRWWFVRFFKNLSKSKSNIDFEKLGSKYEVPIKRVSILASATKPKWNLLMFGFGSISLTAQIPIQVRDLKKRQTSIGAKHWRDNKISGGKGGATGSWRLVKLLGCGGAGGVDNHHPNDMMKIEGDNFSK